METLLRLAKSVIPKGLFEALQPMYHYALALCGALIYRFPSRHIKIVGITGTKGKSSVCELVNAVLEEAGFDTALASTIRFKIGTESRPNLFKMTLPGRFFVQQFLRQAVDAKCEWVVLELTSEGAKQFRHKFIELDALIFTNLAPEHIESHGSYEKYRAAKLELARALEQSHKSNKAVIANADDVEGEKFLAVRVEHKFPYSLKDATPYHTTDKGISMQWKTETIFSPLRGLFTIYNILAAATFAESQGTSPTVVKTAIEKVEVIKGRGEEIREGQDFTVVVDYAHTPDSLRALYGAFPEKRKICVLGNTGGGRDKWKRPLMGGIADEFCEHIILTDEDPYDEDPRAIVEEIAAGITKKKPEIIMDRRSAVARALALATKDMAVLISGKGTDPFIMGPNGSKIPWDDATVVREELAKILS